MSRLRQVVVAARELEPVVRELRSRLPLGEPFADPGVAQFGLRNAVMALGDTFIEVVAPAREDTAAGRFLERRGGAPGGYMLIFQLDDLAAARRRVAELGIRVVWQTDMPDIAGTHLHPADLRGAIVSLDWASPPESWRWAGPAWTGGAPEHGPEHVSGARLESPDPRGLAARYEAVLGEPPPLEFVEGRADRLTGFDLAVPGRAGEELEIAGVRIRIT